MSLNKKNGIRNNVNELMSNVESPIRHKAIITLARKHNISYEEAQFRQALAISKSINRKS
jgi:hypothetical protein